MSRETEEQRKDQAQATLSFRQVYRNEIRRRFRTGTHDVGAIVPDFPGCFAIAPNITEARKMVAEAIEFHIRCLREAGDSVPAPSHHVEDVEVAV